MTHFTGGEWAGDPRDSFLWVWTPPCPLESQLQRPTSSGKPTLHLVTHRPGVGPLFSALGAAGEGRQAGPCFIPPAPSGATVRPCPGPALEVLDSVTWDSSAVLSLLGPQGWSHCSGLTLRGDVYSLLLLRAPWFSRGNPTQPPSRDTVWGWYPTLLVLGPQPAFCPTGLEEDTPPCGWGGGW